jgi:hypothetical protein
MQGALHVAQCCIIVGFISSIHIEFKRCPCGLNCVTVYGTLSGASASYRLGYNPKQVPAHFLQLLLIPLRNFLICPIFWWEVVEKRHG